MPDVVNVSVTESVDLVDVSVFETVDEVSVLVSEMGSPGQKGDPGTPGVGMLYGTGDPPDPTGLPDGMAFLKYEP
jgi:hypothetical protein